MLTWAYFSEVFMGVDTPIDNSARIRGAFYRGSRALSPLAEWMHVPLDQINYVFCGLLSISLGHLLMRRKFSPSNSTPHTRAIVETILGLSLLSFCFGNQLRVLLLQSVVAYAIMWLLPSSRLSAVLVTVWSMFYMTLVHLCRLQYDYGGYTMDISGPVMVQTQRLSSLAFNLADGSLIRERERCKTLKSQSVNVKPERVSAASVNLLSDDALMDHTHPSVNSLKCMLVRSLKSFTDGPARSLSERTAFTNDFFIQTYLDRLLTKTPPTFSRPIRPNMLTNMLPSHIEHAVERLPGPLEFFAYTLCFHGACVGPFVFFSEYQEYLMGYEKRQLPPVPWRYMLRLFLRTTACGLLSAYLSPVFPFEFVVTETFMAWPILQRVLYSTASLFLVRQKYYFAWGLAELGGISSGIGFSGYCPSSGQPIYHKVCNFELQQIESGVGLKHVIDAWNISTTRWLREVFYDRLPHSCRTALVFIISAFWHGFYPGYYLMFCTFAMFTFVSRMWRRNMRTLCRRTALSTFLYNLFTTVTTNVAINYAQAPFHLLDLSASLFFWRAFYFVPHWTGALLLFGHFVRPRLIRSKRWRIPLPHGRTVGG
ncbi:unnamed protein product [Dicrocoelium dendriticum]|nr:unnamed protein product [Dicrocoelium dendriticum]